MKYNDKLTIKLTREGLSEISELIQSCKYLRLLLDGSSHFTENCEWTFDDISNRQLYLLHLPVNDLEVLKFLFNAELKHNFAWEWRKSLSARDIRIKMLKRIIKAITKYKGGSK
tara:strand:+ start:230 stop:571 length:342 start_codon:yes stop_codon:yes gene_type:complete